MAKVSFSFAAILGLLTAIGPLCSDFYLPALPEIATQLNTSTTLTQLSLTSALIGLGLGQLFFGPLSDRIGRKTPLLFSLLLFVLASVLCASTQNIYALIGWRFVQGVAGAGGSVLARSIARDNYHGTMLTQFFALPDDGQRHRARGVPGTRWLYRVAFRLADAVLGNGRGGSGAADRQPAFYPRVPHRETGQGIADANRQDGT